MKRLLTSFACIWILTTTAGCRAEQLHRDQDEIRHALLELYTDQIMDNLIRAHNRMPIIQLDYTDITGTVTHNLSGTLVGSRENARDPITRALSLTIGGSNDVQITITANPVIDDPVLYDTYLQFVKKPGRLRETCEAPPCGAAHIARRCGEFYYWVPVEFQDEFYQLALRTTAKRGDAPIASDAYEVEIKGQVGGEKEIGHGPGGKGVKYRLDIQVDTELPNDRGSFECTVGGHVYKFVFLPYPDAPSFGEDGKTDVLRLNYIKGNWEDGHIDLTPEELGKELAGKPVSIRMLEARPLVRRPVSVSPAIRKETQLNRLDQRRREK